MRERQQLVQKIRFWAEAYHPPLNGTLIDLPRFQAIGGWQQELDVYFGKLRRARLSGRSFDEQSFRTQVNFVKRILTSVTSHSPPPPSFQLTLPQCIRAGAFLFHSYFKRPEPQLPKTISKYRDDKIKYKYGTLVEQTYSQTRYTVPPDSSRAEVTAATYALRVGYDGEEIGQRVLGRVPIRSNKGRLAFTSRLYYPRRKTAVATSPTNDPFGIVRNDAMTHRGILCEGGYRTAKERMNAFYQTTPSPTPPTHNECREVLYKYGDRLKLIQMSSLCPTDIQLAKINPRSSPGAIPQMARKVTNRASSEGFARVAAMKILRDFFGGKPATGSPLWTFGFRASKSVYECDDVIKSRVLQFPDDVYSTFGQAVMRRINHQLTKQNLRDRVIGIGLKLFGGRYREFVSRWDKYPLTMGLDFSGYDSTVPAILIEWSFAVMRSLFPSDRIHDRIFAWLLATHLERPTLLPSGFVTVIKKGIPSGSPFTSVLGSLCNFFLFGISFLRFQKESTLPGKLFMDFDLIVYGDDSLFAFTNSTHLSAYQSIKTHLKDLGMKIKASADEFGPFDQGDPDLSVPFLGMTFANGKPCRRTDDILHIDTLSKWARPHVPLNRIIGKAVMYLPYLPPFNSRVVATYEACYRNEPKIKKGSFSAAANLRIYRRLAMDFWDVKYPAPFSKERSSRFRLSVMDPEIRKDSKATGKWRKSRLIHPKLSTISCMHDIEPGHIYYALYVHYMYPSRALSGDSAPFAITRTGKFHPWFASRRVKSTLVDLADLRG